MDVLIDGFLTWLPDLKQAGRIFAIDWSNSSPSIPFRSLFNALFHFQMAFISISPLRIEKQI